MRANVMALSSHRRSWRGEPARRPACEKRRGEHQSLRLPPPGEDAERDGEREAGAFAFWFGQPKLTALVGGAGLTSLLPCLIPA